MPGFPVPFNGELKETFIKRLTWILIPVLLFTAIGLRWAGLQFVSMDMHYYLIGWYDRLATDGFGALREPFSNYTPPYLYLLFLITKTADFLPKITAIKLLSLGFDFLNAFLIYKILKIKFPKGSTAAVGACAFLLLPTIILNSAYWGQSDAIYAFFVLICLYFLMKGRPLPAMIFLGFAFAFKAQAFFLAPLILLMILKKKIPWFYPGVVPVVYVLLMTPAALAGRPVIELLTIYTDQAETYQRLSMHAPNLYLFFPTSVRMPPLVPIGILITMIVALAWVSLYKDKLQEFTPRVVLLCALVSVAFMPFFLPKMHERYFYLADVISLLVAFYFPRGWLLALGYQLTSGLTYSVFLIASVRQVQPALVGNLLFAALFVNLALLGFLFSNQWRLTNDNRPES